MGVVEEKTQLLPTAAYRPAYRYYLGAQPNLMQDRVHKYLPDSDIECVEHQR